MASPEALAAIDATFVDVLGVDPPPPGLDLLDAGLLDSLMVITLLAELEAVFSIRIPFEELDLEEIRTVDGIAALVDRQPRQAAPAVSPVAPASEEDCLIALRSGDPAMPVFLVPGWHGNALGMRPLVDALDTDRAVYGLSAPAIVDGRLPSVEELAELNLRLIEPLAGDGGYVLGGLSFGGLVAFEMARRLRLAGADVDRLLMLDARVDRRGLERTQRARFTVAELLRAVPYLAAEPRARGGELLREVRKAVSRRGVRRGRSVHGELPAPTVTVGDAQRGHRPGTYSGDVTLMVTADRPLGLPDPVRVWSAHVRGRLTVIPIPGEHDTFLRGDALPVVAGLVSELLASR